MTDEKAKNRIVLGLKYYIMGDLINHKNYLEALEVDANFEHYNDIDTLVHWNNVLNHMNFHHPLKKVFKESELSEVMNILLSFIKKHSSKQYSEVIDKDIDVDLIKNFVSMELSVVGVYHALYLHGKQNRTKMIKNIINTTLVYNKNVITIWNNILIGLFTAFAIEQLNVEQFMFKALELMKNSKIDQYIDNQTHGDQEVYNQQKYRVYSSIRKYLENNFKTYTYRRVEKYDIGKKIIEYTEYREISVVDGGSIFLTSIIAYDFLLQSILIEPRDNQLKAFYHTNLGFDSITGPVSCFWYGLYHNKDVDFMIPQNFYKKVKEFVLEN